MAANEMFVRLATHSCSTNFVHGPKWFYEDVGAFAYTDPILGGMVQRSDKSIPPTFAAKFQPFGVDPNKVRLFGSFLTYGATAAKTKTGRIHIAFDNPPGITNVFRDKEARAYLRKFDPAAAERIDLAAMKLTFDSTNEFRAFQRGSPSARIE